MSESVSEQQIEQESCPSPLGWQEVVSQFEELARPWELRREHYRWTGRLWGEGPPIYFLPGFTGDCRLYALLTWVLRENFKCVLIDYPAGLDDIENPSDPLMLADYVKDFLAIMELHNDSQCVIYATSWGTVLGQQLIACYPNRITASIFHGSIHSREWSLAERILLKLGQLTKRSLGQVPGFRMIQQANHFAWFPPFDRTRMQFYLENASRTPVNVLIDRVKTFSEKCELTLLSEYKQPVLLIGTEGEGKLVHADQMALHRTLPNSQLEMLDNTGALAHLTHPHRIRKLLQSFLEQTHKNN